LEFCKLFFSKISVGPGTVLFGWEKVRYYVEKSLIMASNDKSTTVKIVVQSPLVRQEFLRKRIVQLVSVLSEWGIPVPPVEAELPREEAGTQGTDTKTKETENETLRSENLELEKENLRIQGENEKIAKELETLRQSLSVSIKSLEDLCDTHLHTLKTNTKAFVNITL